MASIFLSITVSLLQFSDKGGEVLNLIGQISKYSSRLPQLPLKFLSHSLLLCFSVCLNFTLSLSAFLKLNKWTLALPQMLLPLL